MKKICFALALILLGIVIAVVVLFNLFFPKQRTYTEAQINAAFDKAMVSNQDQENPMTDVNIDLEAGMGVISGKWQDGQELEGEIVVSADGKSLRSQNVVVVNGGGPVLTDILENVADVVIQAGLDNAVARQGQFKEVRIEQDKIVVIYR